MGHVLRALAGAEKEHLIAVHPRRAWQGQAAGREGDDVRKDQPSTRARLGWDPAPGRALLWGDSRVGMAIALVAADFVRPDTLENLKRNLLGDLRPQVPHVSDLPGLGQRMAP